MRAINIEGNPSQSFAVSNIAAQSGPLQFGDYDVYSDVATFIKVGTVADDVTTGNGYRIVAGNVITVHVPDGRRIGAIAVAGGTLSYQKIG
jgi:hypothetical protein